ncbi:MAG: hypothetical protein KF819_10430 [Labilithrix sp.]|nr:hypothetical protein [Labilithrix sp.]
MGTHARGTLAFALLCFVVGLVAVAHVSLLTLVAGALCVGGAWLLAPASYRHIGVFRARRYLLLAVVLFWPLAWWAVLLLLFEELSDRPTAILGGAALATGAIALLAASLS